MNYAKIIHVIQKVYYAWNTIKNILFAKYDNKSHQMVLGKDNTYHVQEPSQIKIRIKQIIAWLVVVLLGIIFLILMFHIFIFLIILAIIIEACLFFNKKGNLHD